jgi:Ca2+-transporting ATPase
VPSDNVEGVFRGSRGDGGTSESTAKNAMNEPKRATAAAPQAQDVAAVLAACGTDARRGLTESEARERLAQHGRNELSAKAPVPLWRKVLAQFSDVLVLLLIAAAAISAAIWWFERGSPLPYEALAIFAIVVLNAVMGYVQQASAEASLAKLRAMSAAEATVLRGGERRRVPATDLVVGDVILIEEAIRFQPMGG